MRISDAFLASIVLVIGFSCATGEKVTQVFVSAKDAVGLGDSSGIPAVEMALHQKIVQQMEAKQHSEAIEEWKSFIQKYPRSRILRASEIRMAECHYALKNWNQGTQILSRVIQASLNNDAVSAHALYRISFGYEALENIQQALISLLDAEKIKSHLPETVASIELPARIGLMYVKLGERLVAESWFKKTDEGIARYRFKHKEEASVDYPRILYQLGRVHHRDLTMESFQIVTDAIALSQKYSIRAMEFEAASPLSYEARKDLQDLYSRLWMFALTPPKMQGMDPAAAQRQSQDLTVRWLSVLVDLIGLARVELLPGPFEKDSQRAQFLSFLDDLEHQAKIRIFHTEDLTPIVNDKEPLRKMQPHQKLDEEAPPADGPSTVPNGDPNL